MMVAIICEKYGWTLREYYEQPAFFLELIEKKYVIDGKRQQSQK